MLREFLFYPAEALISTPLSDFIEIPPPLLPLGGWAFWL